jgi:DNA repair protein RecO (recombination protein O)
VFDISGGGPLCEECARIRPGLWIRPQTLLVMRALQEVPIERLGEIRVSEETRRELADVLGAYLEHHTGVSLRGREYIRKLEQYGWPS